MRYTFGVTEESKLSLKEFRSYLLNKKTLIIRMILICVIRIYLGQNGVLRNFVKNTNCSLERVYRLFTLNNLDYGRCL